MDKVKSQLIRRWDNARHFPGLANFPPHVHMASETDAMPGTVMSIIGLMDLLEAKTE